MYVFNQFYQACSAYTKHQESFVGCDNISCDWKSCHVVKHTPIVPVVGVRKEGRTLIGKCGDLNWKLPLIELP